MTGGSFSNFGSVAMADCRAICTSSTRLVGSTLTTSSGLQVSLRGGHNACFRAPVAFGATKKNGRRTGQPTRPARVAVCRPVRAGLGDAQNNEKPAPQAASEDWQYAGKLFAGCTAGAGIIKYGSILLPQITEPNLVTALLIISASIVASVVVLTAASSKPSDS